MVELQSAGANSKRFHYKTAQKVKDITKTWVSTGEQFEDLRQKQKHYLGPSRKPSGTKECYSP